MVLESLQASAPASASVNEAPTPRAKFRVRFRKAGDLRLVSHHDLMNLFERTFRRADLHLLTSQGFNPRPKMWFALSLALGIAGLNEVLELEISDTLAPDEIHRRLAHHVPPGIDILSVRAIDSRTSARVRRSWYRLVPATPIEDLSARVAAFLERDADWIERTKPTRRRVNLRPFVSEMSVRDGAVDFALWISPKGAARPEEIVAALGLADMLDAGAVIERADLEIMDELSAGTEAAPTLEHAFEESQSKDADFAEETVSSRPTAIISNPLSFDT